MDINCEITKCETTEYESELTPTPVESDLVQVYDSIDQITNPNSNHIYVVGNDTYVFDGVSFVSISGCDIPVYAGDYTVTAPSEGDLVLPTKDKLMEDDVTIEANQSIQTVLLSRNPTEPIDTFYNDEITELRGYALDNLKGVRVINLPSLTTLVNSPRAISYTSAEEIYLPRISGQCWNGALINNANLRILDFGNQILTNIINLNTRLEVLILRRNVVSSPSALQNIGCPLSYDGVGGYVYVPQALLEQYRASESWQTDAHVLEFRPIEGSEYEIEGLESTSNSIQSFSLNSPLNDTFDAPLETFDTLPLETFDAPLEDEFIPTEELESEE